MKLAGLLLYIAVSWWACNPPNPPQHANVVQWVGVSTYTNGWPVTQFVQYRVYRSTDQINWVPFTTLSAVQWADTNVVAGQTYWYRVTAIDLATNKESQPSNVLALVVK